MSTGIIEKDGERNIPVAAADGSASSVSISPSRAAKINYKANGASTTLTIKHKLETEAIIITIYKLTSGKIGKVESITPSEIEVKGSEEAKLVFTSENKKEYLIVVHG